MLSGIDYGALARGNVIYDHAVDFYSCFLGEPFYIEDCLAYFDGQVLQICAYPFGDPWVELGSEPISAIVRRVSEQRSEPQAVFIWGRLSSSCDEIAPSYRRLWHSQYDDRDVDWVLRPTDVPLKDGVFRRNIERACRRYTVGLGDAVTADHLRLTSEWAERHDISALHAAFARGSIEFARSTKGVVIEAWRDESLAGWLVWCEIGTTGVVLQTFGGPPSNSGVGDALTRAVVDAALARGLTSLRWGYASSVGLSSFKRKWGAVPEGPPYREALFMGPNSSRLSISGPFAWEQRLYAEALGRRPQTAPAASARAAGEVAD